MTVSIEEYATDDPREIAELVETRYRITRVGGRDGESGRVPWRMLATTAGGLTCDLLQVGAPGRGRFAVGGVFLAACLLDGRMDVGDPGAAGRRRLDPGDVVLYPADGELRADWETMENLVLRIPQEDVDRVAQQQNARSPSSVRFTGLSPKSPAHAEQWRSLSLYLNAELGRTDTLANSPLVVSHLTDLVAACALTVFPHSGSPPPPASTAAPAAVARAISFIESRAETPITLLDIADAARVSPPALVKGFRVWLETTPMDHLRIVRLNAARRELGEAEPTDARTRAEILRRWGFEGSGAFAAAYRAAFDRAPDLRCLRSDPGP